MDKNDFDLDIDFEKEYGFDPKDFLSEDDDFDYSDILDEDEAAEDASEDEDATKEFHFDRASQDAQNAEEDDDSAQERLDESFDDDRMTQDDDPYPPEDDLDYPAEDDPQAYDTSDEEPDEGQYDDGQYDEGQYEDGYEETDEPPKKKKKIGLKLPKLSDIKMQKKGKGRTQKPARTKDPAKKSVFSKLLDMYMEPITRAKEESEVLDPLDPRYIRRKKREKKRIFKEVYLPAIIACAALFLILSFVVGSVSNALVVRKNNQSKAQQEAIQQANAADAAEAEYKNLISQADALVTQYDYDGAIELLDGYSGTNAKYKEMVDSKKSDLVKEQQKLSEIKDVSTIPNLSFHVLMADASRACNKDVSGEYAGLYNKNFVSVEEFSRILNQLYTGNYVLVDFDSFIYSNVGLDGNATFGTKSIYLPQGKKPVMITETMVNYFEYMVDPDKDGKLDGKGHGFANKLVVDANGDIKAAYVDGSGQELIGNYDLVPVLESFIAEHPDFVYRGARAILAVTGSEGVFGYRTNTSYVSRFGQAYYDNEVVEAKKVVAALREKGYTIASYTYSNQAYRTMNTLQIQAEVTNWTNQVTPVLGDVDTIVFARGSDIEAYSGTTFNVLYNSGLRYFLNSGSSPRVDVNTTFVRQTRLMVTGEMLAWYSSQFSSYFDSNLVIDLSSRGSMPAKS